MNSFQKPELLSVWQKGLVYLLRHHSRAFPVSLVLTLLSAFIGPEPGSSRQNRRRNQFLFWGFALLGAIARVDLRLDPRELRELKKMISERLSLSPARANWAAVVFVASFDGVIDAEAFATQFHRIFRTSPALLNGLIELGLELAAADGELAEEEVMILADIARLFDSPERWFFRKLNAVRLRLLKGQEASSERSEFESQDSSFTRQTQDSPFTILGVASDATEAEVKAAHRKLVRTFHPDVVIAQGLPEEMIRNATERFREIQEAYEELESRFS